MKKVKRTLLGWYFALSFILVFGFPEELTVMGLLTYLLILANFAFAAGVAAKFHNLKQDNHV